MRRTFIFALLLLAVSAASGAGSQAPPARAHRKASADAHHSGLTGSPANSQARSNTGSRKTIRHTGQRTELHTRPRSAPRATAHPVRYTPKLADGRAHELAGASSGYAAGYKSGYEAGRADALEQLASESADTGQPAAIRTAQKPAPDQAADRAAAARTVTHKLTPGENRPAQDQPPPADGILPAPASTQSAETTEPPPAAPPAETASLRSGMPSPLRGSLESLERQNVRSDAEGLERIEDEDDLSSRIEHKLLVPLPASPTLTVNPSLPEHHRYCRPWTAQFLADLARAHAAVFHRPIEVNSAVRTVEYQKRLMETNGNAAPAEGDVVSPHLTGATVDIAKEGLSRQEISWMRRQLKGLQEAGKIDVEEEFEQACFHITVYKSYAPARPPHRTVDSATSQGTGARRKAGQPGAQQPAAPKPAGHKPASQLPADIAVGTFPAQGR